MTTPLSRLKAAETQFDGRTVIVRADDLAKLLAAVKSARQATNAYLACVDEDGNFRMRTLFAGNMARQEEALTALNEETP